MTLRFLIILLLMLNLLAYAIVRGWLGEAGQLGEPHRISGQLHPERIRLSGDSGPQAALVSAIPALPGADASEDGTTATIAEPEMPPVAPETGPEGKNDAAPTATSAPSAVDETQATVGMSATNGAQASEQTAGTDAEDLERDLAEGDITTAAPSLGSPPAAPAQATCQAWVGLSGEEAELLAQRLRRIGLTATRTRSDAPESWWVRIPPQGSRSAAERREVELNLQGVTDTFIVQEAGPAQYAISLGLFKTEARARVLLDQLRARGVQGAGIEARMRTNHRIEARVLEDQLRVVESAARGLTAKRQPCSPR